jgi:hypothetical protein
LHPAAPVPEYWPLLHLYEFGLSLSLAKAVNGAPTNDAAMRLASKTFANFSIFVSSSL